MKVNPVRTNYKYGSLRSFFEIGSKTDSYAAQRILERVYDTVREEVRTVREGSEDSNEAIQAFKTL